MGGVIRHLFIICAILLFPCSAFSAEKDLIAIDKTPWGMEKAKVAKLLGGSPTDSGKSLIWGGSKLDDYDVSLIYQFLDDKLAAINIHIYKNLDAASSDSLKKRFAAGLNDRYPTRLIEDGPCPNPGECTRSIWQRDKTTQVFLTHSKKEGKAAVTVSYVPSQEVQKDQQASLEKAIVAAIKKEFPKNTPTITVDECTSDTVSVTIRTSFLLPTEDVAAGVGQRGVTGAVRALLAAGKNPSNDNIYVVCHVTSDEGKGLTGKKLTRVYGYARYDATSDGVVWKEAK